MTSVLIVEDEILAAKRLQRILGELEEEYEVLGILDSVKNAAKWLANNEQPDVLFLDIQLGDGLSFEIFDIISVVCPVVFITAFDQYAIDAFMHNGVGYLLKPITKESLTEVMEQFRNMRNVFNHSKQKVQIDIARSGIDTGYKKRFIIKVGDHIKTVLVKDISHIFSRNKATYVKTLEGKSFLLEYSLEQLTELLDPRVFYRISRKYIIALDAINDIISYSNSRLELKLQAQDDDVLIVSREKVPEFKRWLDR